MLFIFMSDAEATPYNTGYSGEIGQITDSTFYRYCKSKGRSQGELPLVFFEHNFVKVYLALSELLNKPCQCLKSTK